MHELGIKQYKSSAYHAESQGALERFHQTLKNMIRSYCFDTDFAVRESVQESLGFSPFSISFWPFCSWTIKTFEREISLK